MSLHPFSLASFGSAARRLGPAIAWVGVYGLLVAFPLVILLLGKIPRGGGYWWDFAMALGFGGLAIMGLQSVLTARFRRATAPFGMDIIYYFHRLAAVGGFGLIVGHYLILRTRYGAALGPLNPFGATWYLTAGRVALLLFGGVIVSSLWRKKLHLEYDLWRISHAVVAVAAIALAVGHIMGVGHYTRAVWKGAVWAGYSVLWVLVVGYVRVLRPSILLRSPYRVTEIRKERGRAWTVTLAPECGPRIDFSPGQFAWLTLRSSPFRAKEHPFSLSGSAADPTALSFTIKELGDFTRTIRDVQVGEVAYVDGPHGLFTTDRHPQSPGFVFIAGGVGIAPLMSMLRTLADRGDSRPLRLIYGNARWDEVLFREEIEQLGSRLRLNVTHVLQEPPDNWTGPTGMLTEAILRDAIPEGARSGVFFVCGPKPMIDAVQRSLRRLGIPLDRIHFELFDMV